MSELFATSWLAERLRKSSNLNSLIAPASFAASTNPTTAIDVSLLNTFVTSGAVSRLNILSNPRTRLCQKSILQTCILKKPMACKAISSKNGA